jgi:hypothetical protein
MQWRQLSHPNILPFLGLYVAAKPSVSPRRRVSSDWDGPLYMVNPWMRNGNITHYLQTHGPGPKAVERLVTFALYTSALIPLNLVGLLGQGGGTRSLPFA